MLLTSVPWKYRIWRRRVSGLKTWMTESPALSSLTDDFFKLHSFNRVTLSTYCVVTNVTVPECCLCKSNIGQLKSQYFQGFLTLPEQQAIDMKLLFLWWFLLSFFTFTLNVTIGIWCTGVPKQSNREKQWTLFTETLRSHSGLMDWEWQKWDMLGHMVSNVSLSTQYFEYWVTILMSVRKATQILFW